MERTGKEYREERERERDSEQDEPERGESLLEVPKISSAN